jgi:Na+/glutamate symporter
MMATTQVRTGKGIAVTVALAAATVGVVYGYDTGSIAGALLSMTPTQRSPRRERSPPATT